VPSPTSVHAPRGLGSVPLALGIRLGIGENESGSPCAGVGARGGRGTSPPAPQPRALCRLLHAVPARGVAALCSHGDAASSGVPQDIVERLVSLKCPGVPPVQSCQQGQAGLTVQLERAAVFEQVLSTIPTYTKPSCSACGQSILLNCVSLRSRRLSLSHLRAILVADHLAGLLRAGGAEVYQVPAVAEEGIQAFLHQLRVEWPSQAASCPEDVVALKQALGQCPHATAAGAGPEGLFKVSLKGFLQEQQGPEGYDPNLDVFLVTEETLGLVAELQSTVLRCTGAAPGGCCSVVHVVSCEEEFWQQKVDLLWRMLDPQAHAALQKHLVCGSVKVPDSPSPLDASQYFQIRRSQLHAASVLKYGDLAQDSWSEMVDILTCAVVRFEMLSAAHRNQIHLALEDTGISTKGTRSGAFVMYNCARLATLFQSYRRAVERGVYAAFPPASELNFASLREEGEWLLLFNNILPFPEVLSQAVQLPFSGKGIRVTANTEAVCKFLVHLSMDFSSYYNRVHILGEPLPHLFSQMFARLQLMSAVRDVLHSALATLHLPPLSQI
uniref:DALR anticodon binding domain containing 3 n=1 Tax=Sphenodon punctatus TaxID=8508 RepID=A0A8D0GI52_SPHPU